MKSLGSVLCISSLNVEKISLWLWTQAFRPSHVILACFSEFDSPEIIAKLLTLFVSITQAVFLSLEICSEERNMHQKLWLLKVHLLVWGPCLFLFLVFLFLSHAQNLKRWTFQLRTSNQEQIWTDISAIYNDNCSFRTTSHVAIKGISSFNISADRLVFPCFH